MKLRQLEIFLTIAEYESIKLAADTLFISQPAVSKSLKELEESIETLLFDRLNGRLYLNTAGKIFQQKAKALLQEYQELTQLFQENSEEWPIFLGASLTFGETNLIPALLNFQKKFPQIPLNVSITNAQTVGDKLLDNMLDIGILANPILRPGFKNIPLKSLELVFVGQEKFLTNGEITVEDLGQLPLLLRENGSSFRTSLDDVFRKVGLPLKPIWTSTSTETLLKGALAGFGVTFVPKNCLTLDFSGLKIARLKGLSLMNPHYLVYLESKASRPSIQALVESVEDVE